MSARATLLDVVQEFSRACPDAASIHVDRIYPEWCRARGLTVMEARILRMAVGGVATRRAIADELGTRPSTVKKQIQMICRKARAESLRDAVILVLRCAMAGAVAP